MATEICVKTVKIPADVYLFYYFVLPNMSHNKLLILRSLDCT